MLGNWLNALHYGGSTSTLLVLVVVGTSTSSCGQKVLTVPATSVCSATSVQLLVLVDNYRPQWLGACLSLCINHRRIDFEVFRIYPPLQNLPTTFRVPHQLKNDCEVVLAMPSAWMEPRADPMDPRCTVRWSRPNGPAMHRAMEWYNHGKEYDFSPLGQLHGSVLPAR
jgi:hypothetical protein